LIATAFADAGIPHRPVTGNVRTAPAVRPGPPEGPGAPRVSATRQGVTVKKPTGGGQDSDGSIVTLPVPLAEHDSALVTMTDSVT